MRVFLQKHLSSTNSLISKQDCCHSNPVFGAQKKKREILKSLRQRYKNRKKTNENLPDKSKHFKFSNHKRFWLIFLAIWIGAPIIHSFLPNPRRNIPSTPAYSTTNGIRETGIITTSKKGDQGVEGSLPGENHKAGLGSHSVFDILKNFPGWLSSTEIPNELKPQK